MKRGNRDGLINEGGGGGRGITRKTNTAIKAPKNIQHQPICGSTSHFFMIHLSSENNSEQ